MSDDKPRYPHKGPGHPPDDNAEIARFLRWLLAGAAALLIVGAVALMR